MAKFSVPLVAMLTIASVEAYALSKGINGVALTTSIAAIAGIAGYKIKDLFNQKEKKEAQ